MRSLSIDGDPDLAVYLDEREKPSDLSRKPDCQSDLVGYDVCMFSSRKMHEDLEILIEVTCETTCNYSIDLIYQHKIEYTVSGNNRLSVSQVLTHLPFSFPPSRAWRASGVLPPTGDARSRDRHSSRFVEAIQEPSTDADPSGVRE